MQATIQYIKESLIDLYPEQEAGSFARIIIEEITGKTYAMILCDKSTKITEEQMASINKIIERLRRFEPIQYIFGSTEFYGLAFDVDENVLIPRPETEELVELILNNNKDSNPSILDIGTGSGCIAITLKNSLKESKVTAWDVSGGALDIARNNAKKNSVDICFQHVDVLKDYPASETFDIIVSNPPYVLESEKAEMEHNVLDNEPHLALFVPDNQALLFYERIADIANNLLTTNGLLYFEINSAKGLETVEMLKGKGYINVELHKDLSGKDRMVRAERPRV